HAQRLIVMAPTTSAIQPAPIAQMSGPKVCLSRKSDITNPLLRLPGCHGPDGEEKRHAHPRQVEDDVPAVEDTAGEVLEMLGDAEVAESLTNPAVLIQPRQPLEQEHPEQDHHADDVRDDLVAGQR